MPKVRHRIGFHDSAFSSDGSSSRKPTNGVRDPLSLFPDVPLNPQHRYCTPPPLDPSLIERDDVEVGFPPSTLSRNPSVSDHLALFEEPPPPPPAGSQDNPILIDEEEDGKSRQPRAQRRRTKVTETPTRRSPRPSSQVGTTANASTRSTRKPESPTTSHSLLPYTKVSQSHWQGPSAGESSRTTNKATANGFTPSTSSPLRQVVYRAPTEDSTTLMSAPAPHVEVRDRWYIPPRKHSTGSVTVTSESSYDSDSTSASD